MIRLLCRYQVPFANSRLTGKRYIGTSIQKESINSDYSNVLLKKGGSSPLKNNENFELYSNLFSLIKGEICIYPSELSGSDSEKRIKIVKIYLYASFLLNKEYTPITKLVRLCHNQRLSIKKGSDLKRNLFIPERKHFFNESKEGICLTDQGKIAAKCLINELDDEKRRSIPQRANDVIEILKKNCWEHDPVPIDILAKECVKYGYRFSASDVKRSICSSRTRRYFILDHKKHSIFKKRDGSVLMLSPIGRNILNDKSLEENGNK